MRRILSTFGTSDRRKSGPFAPNTYPQFVCSNQTLNMLLFGKGLLNLQQIQCD
jgi:hypothetical protein